MGLLWGGSARARVFAAACALSAMAMGCGDDSGKGGSSAGGAAPEGGSGQGGQGGAPEGGGPEGGAGGGASTGTTFVLVHGAFAGAWSWDRVTPALEAGGATVVTVELPAHGADETPTEDATLAAEDAQLVPADLDAIPAAGFVPWLKDRVRRHPAFKHAYYHDFIRSEATPVDLRRYLVQESVVDGRFDDLLALLQLGTDGATKLEIAENYWDEMGNGDAAQVHTLMFSRAMTALAVTDVEMREEMSAEGLLSGNLAMLLCRYRETYPEAVGFLAVTEWLVPDRFSQVLAGWNRLGLDPAGIEYHDAHIAIDARHASGWFNNVVKPGADSPSFRSTRSRMPAGSDPARRSTPGPPAVAPASAVDWNMDSIRSVLVGSTY